MLSDITLQRSIGDKGFRGIATSTLTFRMYSEFDVISTGDSVVFSECTVPMEVTTATKDGNIYSVTACDKCKNLDIPFDYSGYSPGAYPTATVCGAVASQCGFLGASISGRVTSIGYLDMKDKTCRQILEDISVANCGFWYAAESGNLAFRTFSASSGSLVIPASDRTEVNHGTEKYITGIYSEDTTYNKIYTNNAAWTQTEIISGRYMTQANAQAVLAQIAGYTYKGWDVTAAVNGIDDLGTAYSYGMVLRQSYRFGAQIIVQMGADSPDVSYSSYMPLIQRQVNERVKLGERYGCTKSDQNGLNIVTTETAVVNSG